MRKVGLLVNLRRPPPPCARCKITSNPPPPHFQDKIATTPPLTSIFWGRNLTNLHWFPFIHLQTCYISVIRGKPYCQWLGSYWRRNCLNIYFANWQIQLAWSTCMQMPYWESQGPASQLSSLIGFKLSCIVMFVLLVCDFCQTTYSLRNVCSWIFLKKPLINTGYSVCRLIIISIFFYYYYHRF